MPDLPSSSLWRVLHRPVVCQSPLAGLSQHSTHFGVFGTIATVAKACVKYFTLRPRAADFAHAGFGLWCSCGDDSDHEGARGEPDHHGSSTTETPNSR